MPQLENNNNKRNGVRSVLQVQIYMYTCKTF